MNEILGKNQAVRAILAKSEEPAAIKVFSLFALFWAFYTTRTPEQREQIMDYIIGSPCVVLCCVMFFFACML